MSSKDALIESLCERQHIRREFVDIWGNVHRASLETLESLLSAMTIPVYSEMGLKTYIAEDESRKARRILPPVLILSADSHPTIEITLPRRDESREFNWALLEESEELHDGQFIPTDLERIGEFEHDGEVFYRFALTLAIALPMGYHRFAIEPLDGSPLLTAGMALITAPDRCYQPEVFENEGKIWGPAVQLYALKSDENWGIGDFRDLKKLIKIFADKGAALVGLNPLHALFPHNPHHNSPYSPSNRSFINLIYLDVEGVDDLNDSLLAQEAIASDEFIKRLAHARKQEIIDYGDVGSLKRWILELIFRDFKEKHLQYENETERGLEFLDWIEEQGESLLLHARYEAIQESFHAEDESVWGWQCWPSDYQDPNSPEVKRFAEQEEERIQFFMYLQWQADIQLSDAAEYALSLGMPIGLYTDLAVSVDRAGSEVWANQDVFAKTAACGAPPDALAPQGQNWGLPPLIPSQLLKDEYNLFATDLSANMKHAGALRIDHVMSLLRLYWIAEKKSAAEGGYIYYPFDDLIRVVALESHRNQCLVIGEDLGTVPDEVREKLYHWGVLSYRLLPFERADHGVFIKPSDYPRQALVAASTHDLATVAGNWAGRDLDIRKEIGLMDEKAHQEAKNGRYQDRQHLVEALNEEGLWHGLDIVSDNQAIEALRLAILKYLARTPSMVMMVQLEDILGSIEQANLPGTTSEHPNWRRRLNLTIEEIANHSLLEQLVDVFNDEPTKRCSLGD